VPNARAYDPTFAHELATIVQDGIRRMYYEGEDIFYYLTVMNEKYVQPPLPEGENVQEGILKGLYRFRAAPQEHEQKAQLLGSGAILRMALEAQQILDERFGVAADVWSATSWPQLHRDAANVERWNTRHPEQPERTPWLTQCLGDTEGPIVCATDYIKALPDMSARWMPRPPVTLGTDGFGRSDGRESLRDFFEVDAKSIVLAVISRLAREGKMEPRQVAQYIEDEGIDPTKPNPEVL
jgi:pyruvate dehydrogenase E1 component